MNTPRTSRWGGALALTAVLVLALTPALAAPPPWKPGQGKPLRGHISVTVSAAKTLVESGSKQTTTVSHTARHDVEFVDANSSTDSRVVVIRGHELALSATVKDVEVSVNTENGDLARTDTTGQRDLACPLPETNPMAYLCAEGAVWIAIEPAAKRYFFTFNTVPVTSTLTNTTTTNGETFVDRVSATRDLEVTGFRVGPIPLPDTGALTGTRTYPLRARPMRPAPRERNRDGPEAHGSYEIGADPDDSLPFQAIITWHFDEPSEAEATVTIDGYEDWVPMGNLADPSKPGNSLTVSVKAHKPGQPDAPTRANVRFEFRLEGTSMEPGVCMNWPPKPGLPTYGLQLLPAKNPSLDVVGPTEARSRSPGKAATATVSTLSYGAWARLVVEARTEQGGAVKVLFQGKEVDSIPLPLFEHNDHIARAWLTRHGLTGKPADWDGETEPPSRKGPGDGLTLYEEYRGFSVGGKYVTGHPTRRDLFIADETGTESAGVDFFERLTSLVVHRVTKDELGESRVVNRNFAQAPHLVGQHGLRIIRGPGSPEAVGVDPNADPGPPGTCRHIQVPAPDARPTAASKALRVATVAHELCHGVGVFHHGDSAAPRLWFWKQQADGAWQLYEDGLSGDSGTAANKLSVAGRPVPIRAVREENGVPLKRGDPLPPVYEWDPRLNGYKLLVLGKHSQASGDDSCVMAYEDRQAWLSDRDASLRYLPKPGESPTQDHLCSSGEGTGVNAASHRPEPHYGDAAPGRGNCKEQIVVNDGAR